MGADRSRTRLIVGLCLAGLLLAASSALASASKRRSALGLGCKHAVTLTLKHGEQGRVYANYYLNVVRVPGEPPFVEWGSLPTRNYITCSARVQLRDGSWVRPTRINPFSSSTPFGGEYAETNNPQSQFRQIVVQFARSPVPRGASCNYPLTGSAYAGEGIDIKDYSVKFRVGVPSKGQDELDVSINNPRIVICGVMVYERGGKDTAYTLRTFQPTIGPHGGLSSPMPEPKEGAGTYLYARVYARLEPAKMKRTGPHLSPGGCTLETSGSNNGSQSGDTKDFGVKVEATGHFVQGQPFEDVVVVTIHKPGITICSASLHGVFVNLAANTVEKEVTYPVTIGSHGGRSRPITVPWNFGEPMAAVKARRG